MSSTDPSRPTGAHNLKFDPTTTEGAAIVRLFNAIKTEIEEGDGNWNGDDVVGKLDGWFVKLGIDTSILSAPIAT